MRLLWLIFLIPAGSLIAQTITDVGSLNGTNGYNSLDVGTMVLAKDGNFCGTAKEGGANDAGTVFKMTPAGAVTDLYYFGAAQGGGPYSGLIQASDENFYRTTAESVFKITAGGSFTFFPFQPTIPGTGYGGVIQGTDGNLYGNIRAADRTGTAHSSR